MKTTVSIPVGELKPAMAGLAKIIDSRAPLEILRSARVEVREGGIEIVGTDSNSFARVRLGKFGSSALAPFLIPFARVQEVLRRLPAHALVRLGEGTIQCDLGTGSIGESFDPLDASAFPAEPSIQGPDIDLPETFAARFREALTCSSKETTRAILNGVLLDAGETGGHYLVATDGRHLFSANSFTLPVNTPVVIPNLRILGWSGFGDGWSLALEKTSFRITRGPWSITSKPVEGAFPNWRQVVPSSRRTDITLPQDRSFPELLKRFPAGSDKDKGILLVHERGVVSLQDPAGNSSASLPGATATGPDISVCVNRDYLAKAFDFGLTNIGLTDPTSALHFRNEGRQMVVMPIRREIQQPKTTPEQPNPMTATTTNGTTGPHINGTHPVPTHGSERPPAIAPESNKPAIEAAIDNLESFRANLREALAGITAITSLLRQAIRDQRSNEREVQSVRQTLRSLQGVRI